MYVRSTYFRRSATRYIRCISRQLSSSTVHEDGINKATILNASLEHVPEHGWSPAAIEHGAVSLGLPGVAHGVCSNGAVELVEHFESQCNTRLVDYLIKEMDKQPRVKTPQLIHSAVEHRLKMLLPYISRWPEALAIKAHPSHATSSLHTLASMLDDVWYHAGDRSTDFNWYTKRALLGAVYCSTELFMTQDTSVNFHDTWQFLTRRLEDVATVGMTTKQVAELSEGAWLLATAGVTTVLNMLNLNPMKR